MTAYGVTVAVLAVSSGQAAAPTFHLDVAPLVREKCAPCHRPDGPAPFSLWSYSEVHSRAEQIADVTASRTMPPWLPEAGYGSFAGERRLTAPEIELLRRWAEAVTVLERAIEADPRYAEAHNNLGVLLQSDGRLDEAVRSYRRAIAIRPEYAFARHNLGSALLALGELDAAIEQLGEAIRIAPRYALAHYALAGALGRKGRIDEEIEHYRLALEASPDYPEALNNLGAALIAAGRSREAVDPLRKALGLRPGYVAATVNLGSAHRARNELDEAELHYRRALESEPSNGLAGWPSRGSPGCWRCIPQIRSRVPPRRWHPLRKLTEWPQTTRWFSTASPPPTPPRAASKPRSPRRRKRFLSPTSSRMRSARASRSTGGGRLIAPPLRDA